MVEEYAAIHGSQKGVGGEAPVRERGADAAATAFPARGIAVPRRAAAQPADADATASAAAKAAAAAPARPNGAMGGRGVKLR